MNRYKNKLMHILFYYIILLYYYFSITYSSIIFLGMNQELTQKLKSPSINFESCGTFFRPSRNVYWVLEQHNFKLCRGLNPQKSLFVYVVNESGLVQKVPLRESYFEGRIITVEVTTDASLFVLYDDGRMITLNLETFLRNESRLINDEILCDIFFSTENMLYVMSNNTFHIINMVTHKCENIHIPLKLCAKNNKLYMSYQNNSTPKVIPLHLFSFKTLTKRAVMSGEGDADCASSMRNGVKSLCSFKHSAHSWHTVSRIYAHGSRVYICYSNIILIYEKNCCVDHIMINLSSNFMDIYAMCILPTGNILCVLGFSQHPFGSIFTRLLNLSTQNNSYSIIQNCIHTIPYSLRYISMANNGYVLIQCSKTITLLNIDTLQLTTWYSQSHIDRCDQEDNSFVVTYKYPTEEIGVTSFDLGKLTQKLTNDSFK